MTAAHIGVAPAMARFARQQPPAAERQSEGAAADAAWQREMERLQTEAWFPQALGYARRAEHAAAPARLAPEHHFGVTVDRSCADATPRAAAMPSRERRPIAGVTGVAEATGPAPVALGSGPAALGSAASVAATTAAKTDSKRVPQGERSAIAPVLPRLASLGLPAVPAPVLVRPETPPMQLPLAAAVSATCALASARMPVATIGRPATMPPTSVAGVDGPLAPPTPAPIRASSALLPMVASAAPDLDGQPLDASSGAAGRTNSACSGPRPLAALERALAAELAPSMPRLHVSWDGQGVQVWLGVDGAADTGCLLRAVRRVLRDQGLQLSALVCNGRSLLQPRIGAPSGSAASQQES